MDGEGVSITVEEAILEANEDDDVDGIMVSCRVAVRADSRCTTLSTVTAKWVTTLALEGRAHRR